MRRGCLKCENAAAGAACERGRRQARLRGTIFEPSRHAGGTLYKCERLEVFAWDGSGRWFFLVVCSRILFSRLLRFFPTFVFEVLECFGTEELKITGVRDVGKILKALQRYLTRAFRDLFEPFSCFGEFSFYWFNLLVETTVRKSVCSKRRKWTEIFICDRQCNIIR